MLVKKVNPEWKPYENPTLKVGETIEITDPKALILNGDVIGIEEGVEISAFKKYGTYSQSEAKEFESFIEMRHQEALKKKLEEDTIKLQEQIKAVEASKAPVVAEPVVAPEPEKVVAPAVAEEVKEEQPVVETPVVEEPVIKEEKKK